MRKYSQDLGFTLIELLVVITIILIIAALSIPNIMRARIPAHEASAIASIRAINIAEMMYSSSHPQQGFTSSLAMLGGSAEVGGDSERDIDRPLASGRKSGYLFTYVPGRKENGDIESYTIRAEPEWVGMTGQRRFFSDESAMIRSNDAGPADESSPEIQ